MSDTNSQERVECDAYGHPTFIFAEPFDRLLTDEEVATLWGSGEGLSYFDFDFA